MGQTCTGTEWSFLHFTGDERDADTGLDHTLFRQFQSLEGRWLSVDPLAGDISDPQSLNRYAYVLNNPINFFDILGLDGQPADFSYSSGGCTYTVHYYADEGTGTPDSNTTYYSAWLEVSCGPPLLLYLGGGLRGLPGIGLNTSPIHQIGPLPPAPIQPHQFTDEDNRKSGACLVMAAVKFGIGFIPAPGGVDPEHPISSIADGMKQAADFLKNPMRTMALVYGTLGATGRTGEELVALAGSAGKSLGRFAIIVTAGFAAHDAYNYLSDKTKAGECGSHP